MTEAIKQDGGGLRSNKGKLRWSLLPFDGIRYLIRVYEHGAQKYADRNWERGQLWSTPYDSLMRHLTAWWEEGEDYDNGTPEEPGSGLYHMAHVVWNAMALLVFQIRGLHVTADGKVLDDRPKVKAVSPFSLGHVKGTFLPGVPDSVGASRRVGIRWVESDKVPKNQIWQVAPDGYVLGKADLPWEEDETDSTPDPIAVESTWEPAPQETEESRGPHVEFAVDESGVKREKLIDTPEAVAAREAAYAARDRWAARQQERITEKDL